MAGNRSTVLDDYYADRDELTFGDESVIDETLDYLRKDEELWQGRNTSTFAKDKHQSTLKSMPLVGESLDLLLRIERRSIEGGKRNLIYCEDHHIFGMFYCPTVLVLNVVS